MIRWSSMISWVSVRCVVGHRTNQSDAFLLRSVDPLMNRLVDSGEAVRWFFDRPSTDTAGVHAYGADPRLLAARLLGLTCAFGRDAWSDTGSEPAMDDTPTAGIPLRCRSARLALEVIAVTPTRPDRLRAALDLAIVTAIGVGENAGGHSDAGVGGLRGGAGRDADADADADASVVGGAGQNEGGADTAGPGPNAPVRPCDDRVPAHATERLVEAAVRRARFVARAGAPGRGDRWSAIQEELRSGHGPLARWRQQLRGHAGGRVGVRHHCRALLYLYNQLGIRSEDERLILASLSRSLTPRDATTSACGNGVIAAGPRLAASVGSASPTCESARAGRRAGHLALVRRPTNRRPPSPTHSSGPLWTAPPASRRATAVRSAWRRPAPARLLAGPHDSLDRWPRRRGLLTRCCVVSSSPPSS